jgi:hypothetical protein
LLLLLHLLHLGLLLLFGGGLLLLRSLSLHLSFGLGLCLFLNTGARRGSHGLLLPHLSFGLCLDLLLLLRLLLSALLLSGQSLRDLFRSVALSLKGLQLLGIDVHGSRCVHLLSFFNLLLDLNLLLRFHLLVTATLLLLLHLHLSLSFGLCLYFCNLLRGETGSRVIICTELNLRVVRNFLILHASEGGHVEATERIELRERNSVKAETVDLHESFLLRRVLLSSILVEVVCKLNGCCMLHEADTQGE